MRAQVLDGATPHLRIGLPPRQGTPRGSEERLDAHQLTVGAGRERVPEGEGLRMEAEIEPDHHDACAGSLRRNHRIGFLEREGQRLLYVDMRAGLHRGNGGRGVQRGRQADHRRVHFAEIQWPPPVQIGCGPRQYRGDPHAGGGVGIGDGGHADAGEAGQDRRLEESRDPAAAEKAHPQRHVRFPAGARRASRIACA